jgi:alpha-galactosidase
MMGKLGFDIVVSKLDEKELQYCQDALKLYDSVKGIIWHGDQYRLSDPRTGSVASVMYMDSAKKNGVLFNYLVNNRYGEGSKLPILLQGLHPDKKYRVREVGLYPGTRSPLARSIVYSGNYLMTIGINPLVNARRASVVLRIESE